MTVKEIYEKAKWELDHNKITIGEFEKLVDADVVAVDNDVISRKAVLEILKFLRNKGVSVYEYPKWIEGLESLVRDEKVNIDLSV